MKLDLGPSLIHPNRFPRMRPWWTVGRPAVTKMVDAFLRAPNIERDAIQDAPEGILR